MNRILLVTAAATALWAAPTWAGDLVESAKQQGLVSADRSEPLAPASQRFAVAKTTETPDFQKHVLPLMGRLGCNGRACHGSFQGQGGFRLSLFGYDFKMDHEALTKGDSPRVNIEDPEGSKAIEKGTESIPHKGGKRMEPGSWQYRIFEQWVKSGAKGVDKDHARFVKLEMTPAEMIFTAPGQTAQVRVTAHWSDGVREDVTCITRFRTNDDSIVEINDDGFVTAKGKGDSHVVAFYDNGVAVSQVLFPVSDQIGPKYPKVPTPTKIDELVVQKLSKLGVVPSDVAEDTVFLRRVSLDIAGTLPTPSEIEAFLADKSPDKRSRKIDELLERPAYSAWWTTKFCDLTGNNQRFLDQYFRREQSQQWYDWIHKRVKENMPYDEMIAGIVLATSRRPGQSYEDYNKEMTSYYVKNPADFAAREDMPLYWTRRNLRTANDKALSFSHAFLGVRLQCAECHKHPFDQWTQQDFKQFTAFFAPVSFNLAPDARKEYQQMYKDLGLEKKNGAEVRKIIAELVKEGKTVPWREVFVAQPRPTNPRNPKNKKRQEVSRVVTPKVLGGEEVADEDLPDQRQALMDWMRDEENPYFARAFVNRVWANYFNVGIIDPPDDQNLANPPSNEPLLDYLAAEFIKHNFDMKWLHREIANSRTYQLSWVPNETNRLDTKNFSHSVVRRLPAEITFDAISQTTAAVAKADAWHKDTQGRSIAMSGLDYRNRGVQGAYALNVFGKPDRTTTCDCERSNDPNLLQAIYLRNDRDVFTMIDRRDGWIAELAKEYKEPFEPVAIEAQNQQRARQEAGRKRGLNQAIEKLQAQIQEAQKQGNKQQVVKLRNRIKEIRSQLAGQAPAVANAGSAKPGAESGSASASKAKVDQDKLIREAYLRTLSRLPNDEELARGKAHLAESPTTVAGMRDLMWALLNTKEFVVNH